MVFTFNYNPFDWFWIVADNESRFWSSASGSYVDTLPDDATPTRIASERELQDVLAAYSLPGPLPTFKPLSPYQFRAMIAIAGIEQAIDAAVATIPDPAHKAIARAKLDYALAFHRDDPLISLLAPAINLSDGQIDAMWRQAEQL